MTNYNSRQNKGMEGITNVHQRLNFKLSIQMAAPHTWPASVIPVLFSGALVFRQTHTLNWVLWISLILIIALAANTVCLSLGDPQLLRKSILFTSSSIFIYNIFVFSIGGMANELVAIVSSVIGIIRFRKNKKAV